MKLLSTIYLFGLISILPVALAGYTVSHWEWWAICSSLWLGTWWHRIYDWK